MLTKYRSLALIAAVALAGAAACDDATGTGDTTLRVLLTDAPIDYIEAAWVDIGAVQLIPADDGAPIPLSDDGTDGFVNLLELQGTATETLAQADIEAGTYQQLRLIVEAARVELKDGYTFNDGSTERALFVPSGAQTGIKLNLGVADGEEDGAGLELVGDVALVLDFDVNQSFVIQGNPETPAGIHGILFRPTLRVTRTAEAATITGSVESDISEVPAEGLTVVATPTAGLAFEEFQTGTATTPVGEDGTFTFNFLPPGTYVVDVELEAGYETDPVEIEVTVDEGGTADGVNFTVVTAS